MTLMQAIEAPPDMPRFNAFAAYERERDYSRKLETTLSKALMFLDMENSRRALRGEDVAHLKAFVAEAREVLP